MYAKLIEPPTYSYGPDKDHQPGLLTIDISSFTATIQQDVQGISTSTIAAMLLENYERVFVDGVYPEEMVGKKTNYVERIQTTSPP